VTDGSPSDRQAVAIVCGRGSRARDGQKPGTASGASRARNVPRSERGVGGRGAVAVAGACYILHLRESNPPSATNTRERGLAGGSL